MELIIQNARIVHSQFVAQVQFKEIEHVPNQFFQKEIAIEEECLCISHGFFEKYYPTLFKTISKQQIEKKQVNWICQLLLVMNGQNDKAWNIKKGLLLQGQLDIQRELKFNAAVCYKNKKSSTYYEYRMRIFQLLVKKQTKQQLLLRYSQEIQLLQKILGRFFRNYFVWMYRNRLLKLLHPFCKQQIVEVELTYLHKFIESHPNDYSAYSRLISIVSTYNCNLQSQDKWIRELLQFCIVAFEKKQSYHHIQTYQKYLEKASNQPK